MLRNCPPVLGVVRVLLGMTRCVGNWRGVGQASPGRVRLCVITCLNQVVCQSTLSNKCAVSRGVLLFYLFIFEWIWMLRRHGLGGAVGLVLRQYCVVERRGAACVLPSMVPFGCTHPLAAHCLPKTTKHPDRQNGLNIGQQHAAPR